MKEITLSNLEGYPALNVRKAAHKQYEDTHPIESPSTICDSNALVGIEVEVEGLRYPPMHFEYYWTAKEDHSLRNHGWEYTSIPLRGHQIEHALIHLHDAMCYNPTNKPDYSPRTSIHVHMNVRDFTWSQVKTFVLLYSIFERHFFHIAGTKRESSIFCVPLYKTQQIGKISALENAPYHWSKYSALNLGCITGNNDVSKYGTIEFRHLYGTGDRSVIINWINNIFKLRRAAAVGYKFEELLERVKHMNTTSEYVALYQEVFGEFADTKKMMKYDFEDCVTHTKIWEWGDIGNLMTCFSKESRLSKLISTPEVAPKVQTLKEYLTGEKLFAATNFFLNKPINLDMDWDHPEFDNDDEDAPDEEELI